VTVISAALLAATLAQAQAAPQETFRLDCRYTRPSEDPDTPARTVFLPDDDIVTPPMADPREPRMALAIRQERFIGPPFVSGGVDETITAGFVRAGGHFGLVGRRREGSCNGWQTGIFGGASAQFNLDAARRDLIATDFVIGVQLSARKRGLSARFRVYHQSSHFGDEFLVHNPDVEPMEFGFEAIDGLISLDGSGWRLYAGGGYIFFAFAEPDSKLLQAGLELRRRSDDGGFRPVAAADVIALSSRDWGTTTSIAAGFEWTSPAAVRRMRTLVVFVDGFTPHGQFLLQQRIRGAGLQAQFDF
jgi:hypothetical protein